MSVCRLAIGGWADAYTDPVFRLMHGLRGYRRAIVGPWGHDWPDSGCPGPQISYLQQCVAFVRDALAIDDTLHGSSLDDGRERLGDEERAQLRQRHDGMLVYEQHGETLMPTEQDQEQARTACYQPGRWVHVKDDTPALSGTWQPPDHRTQALFALRRDNHELERLDSAEHALACGTPHWHAIGLDVRHSCRSFEHSSSLLLGLEACGDWLGWGGPRGCELPLDQRLDDSRSLTLTSARLTHPLRLLGFPQVFVTFSVDQPIAQINVRLCQVNYDDSTGLETASVLLSKAVLNLNHSADHEHVVTLRPDAWYCRPIVMQALSVEVPAGASVRLSFSTSYWPMCWPSPKAFTMRLCPSLSYLQLPLLDESATLSQPDLSPNLAARMPSTPFDQPIVCHGLDVVTERPSSESRSVLVRDDGMHMLHVLEDAGATRYPDGLVVDETTTKSFFISDNADPLTARIQVRSQCSMRSPNFDDMAVELEIECDMWSDESHFHLSENLRALDHGVECFQKRWDSSIPRQGV